MLSNKLTFSLVFLVMLAFAFVATPAMAQDPVNTALTGSGFAIVERSGQSTSANATDPNNGISGSVTDVQDPDMPNLEEFFRWGGTIELSLAIGTISGGHSSPNVFKVGTPTAGDDNKGSTALISSLTDPLLTDKVKEDFAATAKKHPAVITEIMWGLNLTPGTANEGENVLGIQNEAQWIEVHTNGNTLAASDNLTLEYFPNKTQYRVGELKLVGSAVHVIVDSVSARNRFGVAWTLHGNSGNTEPIDEKASANLVSMYRKRDLAAGAYKDKTTFGRGDEGGSWAASGGRTNITGYFVGSPRFCAC